MKRSKHVSRRRDADDELPAFARKPPEKTWVWQDDVATQPDASFVPYSMGSKYKKGALLSHEKFGRGVVVKVEETRIEVLFESGAKKLGHASS